MRPALSREPSATAFELAARLDRYEAGLDDLGRHGFDARRGERLTHELRDIGSCGLALPRLAADLMQITIQHFALLGLLCRRRPAGPGAQAATALLEQQCVAVGAVRQQCLRSIARSHEPRALDRSPRHRRAAFPARRPVPKEVP